MFNIKYISVLIAIQQLFLVSASVKFDLCNFGNNTCIVDTINNKIFTTAANGITELNLTPLEPLRFKQFTIEQGGQSSVRVKLYFKNVAYHGFTGAKALKIKMPSENIDGEKFYINFELPFVSQVGVYKVNGTVLFLPIYGQGDSNMTFVNSTLKFRSIAKSYEKNGEKYLQVDKAKLKIDTSRLHMDFTKLFNSKGLSDNMNRFLNNHWKVIYTEVQSSVENAFVDVVKSVINDVFKTAPYRKMFSV